LILSSSDFCSAFWLVGAVAGYCTKLARHARFEFTHEHEHEHEHRKNADERCVCVCSESGFFLFNTVHASVTQSSHIYNPPKKGTER